MPLVTVQKSKKKQSKMYGGKIKRSLKNPKKMDKTCQSTSRKVPFSIGTGLHPMFLMVFLVSMGLRGNKQGALLLTGYLNLKSHSNKMVCFQLHYGDCKYEEPITFVPIKNPNIKQGLWKLWAINGELLYIIICLMKAVDYPIRNCRIPLHGLYGYQLFNKAAIIQQFLGEIIVCPIRVCVILEFTSGSSFLTFHHLFQNHNPVAQVESSLPRRGPVLCAQHHSAGHGAHDPTRYGTSAAFSRGCGHDPN